MPGAPNSIMAKRDTLPALNFLQAVEYDYTTGAYKYTRSGWVESRLWGERIKEYGGYLWIRDQFYARVFVDALFEPFVRIGMTHRQIVDSQDPKSDYTHEGLDGEEVTRAITAFEDARLVSGQLHPGRAAQVHVDKARQDAIARDFVALRDMYAENEKHNKRSVPEEHKEVRPVNKIIIDVAKMHDVTPTTVRNALGNAGLLTTAMIGGKHRPLAMLRREDRYFTKSYETIADNARIYYTKGFGRKDGDGRFLVDLTKMLPFDGKEYYLPDQCGITMEYFNDESMRNPGGRNYRWNDIVIGRRNVYKPAHYENLAFMTRLARDILEMQHKYTEFKDEPWRKLNCTEQEWREAKEKTEYGISKYMEMARRK